MDDRESDRLLAGQRAHYSEIAADHELGAIPGWGDAALVAFWPAGDVLELACGPGSRTRALAELADKVTAVDGSQEMLEHARERRGGSPRRRSSACLAELGWRITVTRADGRLFWGARARVQRLRFTATCARHRRATIASTSTGCRTGARPRRSPSGRACRRLPTARGPGR